MKHLRIAALLGAATFLSAPISAFAQDVAPEAIKTATPAKIKPQYIQLQKGESSLVAYWLDPKNNPMPFPVAKPPISVVVDGVLTNVFPLPASVKSIRALPNNILLCEVEKTEDWEALRKLFTALDQPVREIEIETYVVLISPENAKQLGVHDAEETPNSALSAVQIGFSPANFSERLDALVKTNQAKIWMAPTMTALNTSTPPIEFPVDTLAQKTNGVQSNQLETLINITPTINRDESINLDMELPRGPVKAGSANLRYGVNARNGATISLSGLTPMFDLTRFKGDPQNVVVFLTARIAR